MVYLGAVYTCVNIYFSWSANVPLDFVSELGISYSTGLENNASWPSTSVLGGVLLNGVRIYDAATHCISSLGICITLMSSLKWLSKIYESAWQGSKVAPDNLKNSNIKKDRLDFFYFAQSREFMRYVQFSGHLGTTGVTKRVISWTRSVFMQWNIYHAMYVLSSDMSL